MTDDEERLRSLELIVAAGAAPFPADEFEQLSVGSQLTLESRMRNELEGLGGRPRISPDPCSSIFLIRSDQLIRAQREPRTKFLP